MVAIVSLSQVYKRVWDGTTEAEGPKDTLNKSVLMWHS